MKKNYQKFLSILQTQRTIARLLVGAIAITATCLTLFPTNSFAQIGQMDMSSAQLAEDAPQSVRDLLAKAHRNDIDAMYEIALYLMSKRTSDDDAFASFAFGWSLYAGRSGHAGASELTGSMYRRGIGVEQNFVKARKWLERALARGSKEPNFELALLYSDEANPSLNQSKAANYLNESIRLSEPRACLISARSKINEGAEFRKVITEVKCAAEGGLVAAMEMLALFNLNQRSPYSEIRARKWLMRAAEEGSETAAAKLAELNQK